MGRARTGVVVLMGTGALAATLLVGSQLLNAPSLASLISDSPKEVIDQTWQIVFRDYLDTSGKLHGYPRHVVHP